MWNWRPLARGPMLGWGLGLVAGGMEVVARVAPSAAAPSIVQGVLLGLLGVLSGGLLGLLAGFVGGLGSELVARRRAPPVRNTVPMAVAGFLLAGWYIWPLAWLKVQQDLIPPAAALALMPIGVAGVVWGNAKYWFRREEIGERRKLGWWFVSAVVGLTVGVGAGVVLATAKQGGKQALDVDASVLLVTIEGLGEREYVSCGSMPTFDALARRGVRFSEAISPIPETVPAHAALLTGHHPARMGVFSDEHPMGRSIPTVPDRLRREGYATAAFVSTLAADRWSGLSRGFAVYDDDRLPSIFPPAAQQLALVGAVQHLWMNGGHAADSRAWARPDAETVDRAVQWLDNNQGLPQFVWVQLAGPQHAAGGNAVWADVDAQLARVVDAFEASAGEREHMMVVVGTGGGNRVADGISERRVRVPMVLVPRKMRVFTPQVALSVRLMDVAATILDQLGFKPIDNADGTDLSGFAEGTKTRGYATLLVGRVGGDAEPVVDVGYRAGRQGADGMVKLRVRPLDGAVHFYDLSTDPWELDDLATVHAEAAASLRGRALAEAGAAASGLLPRSTASADRVRWIREARFGTGVPAGSEACAGGAPSGSQPR